jgi:hypothetical protein
LRDQTNAELRCAGAAGTGALYFEAEIAVPELLKPGVPATVLIRTGSRTLLGYLFEPILRAHFRALREE